VEHSERAGWVVTCARRLASSCFLTTSPEATSYCICHQPLATSPLPFTKMSQQIATILASICIIGLFVLDRDGEARTSKALWIPSIYLLLICSRPVSSWLGVTPPDAAMYGDGIYSSPIDQFVSLGLLALGFMTLIARKRKVGLLLRGSGPIVLFYSYAALSILWSDFPYFTFKHWIKAVEDVVIVLIVWTDRDPVMAVKRILTRAGFILIPLSLLFCKYYPDLGRSFNKDWETVYNGVADTKNSLGVICLIFGLASLWCFLGVYGEHKSRARRRHLLAHSILLGIVVVLLGMSHSMTASVNLVLGGTVMIVVSRRLSRANVASVHFAVGAALCCAVFPLFVAPSLVQSLGRDATFSGRTTIWHILIESVRYPWLGTGYETFLSGPRLVQLKAIIDKTFQEAHNGYLEVWLNLGWIGVSLFALLVLTGYRNAVAAYRRDPAVGSLRLAFFTAVIIEGLTEAPFRMMSPTWFLLLWAMIDDSMTVPVSPRRQGQGRSLGARGWSGRSAMQERDHTNESEIPSAVSTL
jgi:exopolysaccharide production protein ExoQ